MAADTEFPTVRLAGKDYPVRPLVISQLRKVVPAMMRLGGMTPKSITEEQYDDLIEVVYQAIAPAATPPISRADFMNLDASLPEMIEAINVVMKQAGLVQRNAAAGEAPAANPSTGTQS